MAGTIKGITIEFNGETTKLSKAMSDVNGKAKSLDTELKNVNKALKFSPDSATLLSQKQTILNEKIATTKTKLEAQKQAMAKANATEGVDKNSAEYRKLQREIVESESKLKLFEAQAKQLNNIKMTALGNQIKKVGEKMTAIGKTMTTRVTAPVVAGFVAMAKQASDMEESTNKVDVAFGDSAKAVKKFAETSIDSFGVSKGEALDMASTFGDMGTSMGLTQDAASKMSISMVGLSGDLASFKNISTDEAMTALNGVFTGETESLKKLGIVMTEQNLKQFALSEGYSKSYDDMTQAEKVQLRYAYVTAQTTNAQGDYARTADGTANSMRTLIGSLQDAAAELGEVLLPIITPIIQKFTKWIKMIKEMSPEHQKLVVGLLAVVAAAGPILVVIGAISTGVGTLMTIIPGFFTMLAGGSAILGPYAIPIIAIGLAILFVITHIKEIKKWGKDILADLKPFIDVVKAAFDIIKEKVSAFVAAFKKHFDTIKAVALAVFFPLIAVGLLLIKNWDKIKAKAGDIKDSVSENFTAMKNKISSIFGTLKEKMTSPFKNAWSFIKGIVRKIKNAFNFSLKFPKISLGSIKLPHFKITGSFSIKKKTVPKLGISWYKNGGIFDSPTIFNTGNGYKGVGEAGPEAVTPLSKLRDYIAEDRAATVKMLAKELNGGGTVQNINIYQPVKTPSEVARALRNEQITQGLAGAN